MVLKLTFQQCCRSFMILTSLLLLTSFVDGFDELEDSSWPEGEVQEVDATLLERATQHYEYALVEFMAPWCGACKALAPELDRAAALLAGNSPPIAVLKVDTDANKELAKLHGIKRLPTLKLYVRGEPREYLGPTSAAALVSHLRGEAVPNVTALAGDAAVRLFSKQYGGTHLALFLGFGVEEAQLADVAARYKGRAWFAAASGYSERLMRDFDFDRSPALVAMHAGGEQEVFYGPFGEGEDLREFVRLNYMPLIGILDETTYAPVVSSGRSIALIFADFDGQAPPNLALDSPDPAKVESPAGASVAFVRRCKQVARAHRAFLVVYVDATKFPTFAEPFGVRGGTPLPTIVVWNGGTEYYVSDSPADFLGEDMEFALTHFLQNVTDGKLVARTTLPPSAWQRVVNVVGHPNFPWAVAIVLIGIAMKIKQGGAPILLQGIRGFGRSGPAARPAAARGREAVGVEEGERISQANGLVTHEKKEK